MFDNLAYYVSTSVKWTQKALSSRYRLRGKKPVHILFCMVDHYEPGTGNVGIEVARKRVDLVLSEYPRLADRHRDSDGCVPKRTWFFPPHYHDNYFLRDLVSLCAKGYGEIELHLHHGKTVPDTPDNLEKTLRQCIKEYSYFGIFGAEEGVKKFAFVHGDWALANSRRGQCCGVNNEIDILRKTGCFADFTLPTPHIECNPAIINAIYYATSTPDRPKAYDTGTRVKVLGTKRGDLMIIQGPLTPFFKNKKPWGFRIYGDVATLSQVLAKRRVDTWVRTGICVEGKEDWIIIKTHTHGATGSQAVLGDEMDAIFGYLETKYNNGTHYVLHYVTARELYNIIKAAEAGEPLSDPGRYRDYLVTRPAYHPGVNIREASRDLRSLVSKTYQQGIPEPE